MCDVSIILPYYKKKKFIENTINSILTQTYKNFEIIIIYDDEDKSELELIKSISNSDERIKLIINNNNLGAGYSRNIGINSALGNYISFLDADDLWKSDKLSKQIKFMKDNDYYITHTSYEIVDNNNKLISLRKAKNFQNYQELLPSCDIGLSTVIVKKKIFLNGVKFPNLKTKEDFVVWLEILKRGYKIYSLDEYLVSWVKSKNSLSSSSFQKLKDSFTLYNYFMKFNFIKSIYYTFILSVNFIKKNL